MSTSARRAGLHPRSGFNAQDAERQARREAREDRNADERIAARHRERFRMTRKRTTVGDEVERFPDTAPVREQIAEVREALVDAFEEAARAKALQAQMDATHGADANRFSVLKAR